MGLLRFALTICRLFGKAVYLGGFHGTCRSRAESILRLGPDFNRGQSNTLLGRGLYFWRDGHLAKTLAQEWFDFQSSTWMYANESDGSFSCIRGDVAVFKGNHFDLNAVEVKRFLEKYALENPSKSSSALREQRARAIVAVILELEKTQHVAVIEGLVPPPKGSKYPTQIGFPNCFVVRSNRCMLKMEDCK